MKTNYFRVPRQLGAVVALMLLAACGKSGDALDGTYLGDSQSPGVKERLEIAGDVVTYERKDAAGGSLVHRGTISSRKTADLPAAAGSCAIENGFGGFKMTIGGSFRVVQRRGSGQVLLDYIYEASAGPGAPVKVTLVRQ